MHRDCAALLLALVLPACGGTATAPPAAPTPPAPAPLLPAAPTPADAERVAAELRAHVDATRGLVFMMRLDSEDDSQDTLPDGLLCDPARIGELSSSLADYLAERASWGEPFAWECTGEHCELPGSMEYDPYRVLRFARRPDGSLVVVAYYELDLVLTDEEYQAQVRAEAGRLFETASRGSCR